jgi:hypothetical protein
MTVADEAAFIQLWQAGTKTAAIAAHRNPDDGMPVLQERALQGEGVRKQ